MLKSITRHVHIFTATIDKQGDLEPAVGQLTLDVDPDNELNWTDAALQKVYGKFEALVATFEGRDLTEYNLRRIGSELEHFIRGLLRDGVIAYNLTGRALNYSMGFPQTPVETIEGQYIPERG